MQKEARTTHFDVSGQNDEGTTSKWSLHFKVFNLERVADVENGQVFL